MKRSILNMLAIALLVGAFSVVVYAATNQNTKVAEFGGVTFTTLDSIGTWEASDTTVKGEVKTESRKGRTPRSSSIKIENTGIDAVKIEFDVKTSGTANGGGNSVKLEKNTLNAGTGKIITMDPGTSQTLTICSGIASLAIGTANQVVTLSNITVSKVGAVYNATLYAGKNGTYSAEYVGDDGKSKNADVSKTDVSIIYRYDDAIKLTAVPTDGYKFDHWANALGDTISESNPYTVSQNSDGLTVRPVFIPENMHQVFKIGGNSYFFWEDAVQAAVAGSNKTIVLTSDYTLPDSLQEFTDYYGTGKACQYVKEDGEKIEYYLPSGVKLLVPYSDSDGGNFGNPTISTNNNTKTVYRTLTIGSNTVLKVAGDINVNALQYANSNNYISNVTGAYGKIRLASKSSQIELQNNAKLYCYGYISGDGQVHALDGSYVYEFLQVTDWRGGTETSNWMNGGYQTFVFSQYYVQNIEADFLVEAGAGDEVKIAISALKNIVIAKANAEYIGKNSGLFQLREGTLLRSYDTSTDRMIYKINGTVVTGSIDVTMTALGVNYKLNSANYVMGLNGNMTVDIESGSNVTMGSRYQLLPDGEIKVAKDATLTIANDSALYLWDVKDWNAANYVIGGKLRAISYTVANGTTVKRKTYTKSALLQVDGTLNTYNNVYVTENSNTSLDKVILGKGIINNQSGSMTNSLDAIKDNSTKDTITTKAAVGRMYDSTNTYDSFGLGTYYSKEKDGVDKWYKYVMNCKFMDESGAAIDGADYTDYITTDSYTCKIPDGYVIVNQDYSDVSSNVSCAGENGITYREDLMLKNISKDTTVTITLRKYDSRVLWVNNNSTVAHYVAGNTDTYTFDTPTIVTDIKLTGTGSYKVDQSGENTAVKLTGLSGNVTVNMTTNSNAYKVVWTVGENTVPMLYQKGDPAVYTLSKPMDGWDTITGYTITGQDKVSQDPAQTVSVSGLSTTTYITLETTHYDYKISYAATSNTTDTLTIQPTYINADSTASVKMPDKYAIESVSVAPEAGVNAAFDQTDATTLKISSATADSTVTVRLYRYDWKVQFKDKENNILDTQYVLNGVTAAYDEFKPGTWIKSILNGITNAVISNPKTSTERASVKVEKVTSDTTVTVDTGVFDHVVTWVDDTTTVSYVSGNTASYAYKDTDKTVITGYQIDGGEVVSVPEAQSIDVPVTKDCTITLQTAAYAYKVTWNAGKTTTYTYVKAGESSATYNCAGKNIATNITTTVTGSTALPTIEGEGTPTITVSNISADIAVNFTLVGYDYVVKVNAGTESKTYYVKDSKNVQTNAEIGYLPTGKVVITGCDIKGTATVTHKGANSDVKKGWTSVTLTDIKSDVTATITLSNYDYAVTWNVSLSKQGTPSTVKEVHYITGLTDSYTVADEYNIDSSSINASGATAVLDGLHTVKVSDISQDASISFSAADYVHAVTWVVNGERTTEYLTSGDDTSWTNPTKGYVITEVHTTGKALVSHTNQKVTVSDIQDKTIVISITTKEALDTYEYLVGDMSYQYAKNSAIYTWDGSTSEWNKEYGSTFAWQHRAGSKSKTFTESDGTEKTYTVANGSILLLNKSNQIVTYTVELTDRREDWANMTFEVTGNESDYHIDSNGMNQIVVTVQAGKTVTVVSHIEGEANASELDSKGKQIGNIKVTPVPAE